MTGIIELVALYWRKEIIPCRFAFEFDPTLLLVVI